MTAPPPLLSKERNVVIMSFHGCNLCPYRTKITSNLFDHKQRHRTPQPFNCANKPEQPFKCSRCTLTTTMQCVLINHIQRNHKKLNVSKLNWKPYECLQCDFHTSSRLIMWGHMYKYQHVGSYMCKYCSVTTNSEVYLHNHYAQEHPNEMKDMVIKCKECFYVTDLMSNLFIHVQLWHCVKCKTVRCSCHVYADKPTLGHRQETTNVVIYECLIVKANPGQNLTSLKTKVDKSVMTDFTEPLVPLTKPQEENVSNRNILERPQATERTYLFKFSQTSETQTNIQTSREFPQNYVITNRNITPLNLPHNKKISNPLNSPQNIEITTPLNLPQNIETTFPRNFEEESQIQFKCTTEGCKCSGDSHVHNFIQVSDRKRKAKKRKSKSPPFHVTAEGITFLPVKKNIVSKSRICEGRKNPQISDGKRFNCKKCLSGTYRESSLKRHVLVRHKQSRSLGFEYRKASSQVVALKNTTEKSGVVFHSCVLCPYRTKLIRSIDDHVQLHISKAKLLFS